MATRKDLKQTINQVCSDLFAEGVASYLYGPEQAKENIDALLSSVIVLRNDFVARISHPEPGMPAKKYYQQLRADFSAQAGDLVDQICNLH